MPSSLRVNVHIDGQWYRPGEIPPPDVAERITNPDAWDGPAPAAPVQVEPVTAPVETPTTTPPSGTAVKQPPRKGPGSGGPAWIEYAASKGVTETFGSKDELIAALQHRGLLDEE